LQRRFLKPVEESNPPVLVRVNSTTGPATVVLPSSQSDPGAIIASRAERLLAKYRGGMLGLVEVMGNSCETALLRNAVMNDAEIMRELDIVDVASQLAKSCEQVAKKIEACIIDAPRKVDLPLLRGIFPLKSLQHVLELSVCIEEIAERMTK